MLFKDEAYVIGGACCEVDNDMGSGFFEPIPMASRFPFVHSARAWINGNVLENRLTRV
jgi:hypothetical protein